MKSFQSVVRAAASSRSRNGLSKARSDSCSTTCVRTAQAKLYSNKAVHKKLSVPIEKCAPETSSTSVGTTDSDKALAKNIALVGTAKAPKQGGKKGKGKRKYEEDHPRDQYIQGAFRRLMRHVPSPVVVVTSVHWPGKSSFEHCQKHKGSEPPSSSAIVSKLDASEVAVLKDAYWPMPRAMTVSSFSSASLKPKPTVMFNISLPSRTFAAIATSRRFNVHVLANTTRGTEIAHHFAQGHSCLDPSPVVNNKPLKIHGKDNYEREWKATFDQLITKGTLPDRLYPFRQISMPIIDDEGVLFTLQCRVRPPRRNGKNRHSGGIWELDQHTAIVIGFVEDVFARSKSEDAIGLSYAQNKYRRNGTAHRTPSATTDFEWTPEEL